MMDVVLNKKESIRDLDIKIMTDVIEHRLDDLIVFTNRVTDFAAILPDLSRGR